MKLLIRRYEDLQSANKQLVELNAGLLAALDQAKASIHELERACAAQVDCTAKAASGTVEAQVAGYGRIVLEDTADQWYYSPASPFGK